MKNKIFLILLIIFSFICIGNVYADSIPTLNEISEKFNNSSTAKSYKEIGNVLESSVDGQKLIVKLSTGEMEYILSFVLKGNILVNTESMEGEKHIVQSMVALIVIDSIEQIHGYNEGEIYQTLGSEAAKSYTVDANGFEYVEKDGTATYKVDISKKIDLLDISKIYISVDDLQQAKEHIKGDGFSSGTYGNLYYSYNGYDNDKTIFIAEKPEITENTYKSLISFLSVIFDSTIVDAFKEECKSITNENINYLGISIDVNPELDESQKNAFSNYKFIKVTFNYDKVITEFNKIQQNKDNITNFYIGIGTVAVLAILGIIFLVLKNIDDKTVLE